MTEHPKAVFLSYASQDAEAARGICEALRAAGVEVWFDQSELVGGDAWDAKIRKQIAECALFVPLISATTQARREGYFRIEWRLAGQRTHAFSDDTAFLLPVVLDDTRDADARVPAEFKSVQWTRLRPVGFGGEAPDEARVAFCARVKKLLGGEAENETRASTPRAENVAPAGKFPAPRKLFRRSVVAGVAAGLLLLIAFAVWRPWQKPPAVSEARRLVAQARVLFEDRDTANRENFTLAEELLKRALALEPGDGEGWAAAAQLTADVVTYSFDRTPARVELLKTQAERAIKLAPESLEAQVAYASYFRRGSHFNGPSATAEDALRRLQAVVERAPNHRRALRELAQTYFGFDRYEEAYAAFERANAAPGGDPEALVMKAAYLFTVQGRYADAEDAIARAIAARPLGRALTVDALLKLAWRGDVEAAAAAVTKFPAWLLLEDRGAFVAYETCMWRGEAEKALAVLKGVPRDYLRDVYFNGPKAALNALAYEKAGQPLAARREWESVKTIVGRMFEADSAARDLLLWKAVALARLGEREPAEKLYRELDESHDLRSLFWSSASPAVHLAVSLDRIGDVAAKVDGAWRALNSINPRAIGPAPQAALKCNPVFASVRAAPEFQGLMARAPAPSSSASRPPVASGNAKAPDKSVAVLPFANLSAEKNNEIFVEGIHDDVITNLQKIRDLKVISRTSMLAYRDASTRNLAKIADELNVATIVEGTVARVGNQVRVNAKLLHAHTEASLWADTLNGDATDLFALQAIMAQKIAAALKATLTEGERSLIERRPTKNPVAYELFLRARLLDETLTSRTNIEYYERTIAAYQSALAEDPGLALAYSRLTNLHGLMYWLGHLDPTPRRRALADAALQAAVRLDPDAPETHYARGSYAYFCDNDFVRALTHYRQAEIGLPNDASLQGLLAFAHRRLGHWHDYVQCAARAVELSPRYLYVAGELAGSYLDMRRFEAARQLAARFAAMFPDDAYVADTLARSEFALSGDRTAFLDALVRAPRSGRDPTGLRADYERAMLVYDFATAERVLADPRLTHIVDAHGVLGTSVMTHRALVAFLLGKKDEARDFADQAIVEYARGTWTARQRPLVAMEIAAVHAYAGRMEEAIREARLGIEIAATGDAYVDRFTRYLAGRIWAAVGRNDEALEILRGAMSGICRYTPNEIRLDPCWSRLKDDPRFEEILKSAKPL